MTRLTGPAAIYSSTITSLEAKMKRLDVRVATLQAEKNALLNEISEQRKKLTAAQGPPLSQ